MSIFDLSSTNASHLHRCSADITTRDTFIKASYIVLLLPLSAFVLALGLQRWKRRRSPAAMSFSDFFTYNLAVMELIGAIGSAISICASYTRLAGIWYAGALVESFPWSGQMYFPLLTCAERYLAVVQPVTYLRLRKGRGVRIRNAGAGGVWLLCLAGICYIKLMLVFPKYILIPISIVLLFCLTAVIFCCLSILCILIRPRPGDGAQVDQSKRRALRTITVIMGVLVLRFGGSLVNNLFMMVNDSMWCMVPLIVWCCNLPSSLVLPLLFLHRAAKLPACKHQAAA